MWFHASASMKVKRKRKGKAPSKNELSGCLMSGRWWDWSFQEFVIDPIYTTLLERLPFDVCMFYPLAEFAHSSYMTILELNITVLTLFEHAPWSLFDTQVGAASETSECQPWAARCWALHDVSDWVKELRSQGELESPCWPYQATRITAWNIARRSGSVIQSDGQGVD